MRVVGCLCCFAVCVVTLRVGSFGPCEHEVVNFFTQFFEIDAFECDITWYPKRSLNKKGKLDDYDVVFAFSARVAEAARDVNATIVSFGGGPGLNPRRFPTPLHLMLHLRDGLFPLDPDAAHPPSVSHLCPAPLFRLSRDARQMYIEGRRQAGGTELPPVTPIYLERLDDNSFRMDPNINFPLDIARGASVLVIQDIGIALAFAIRGAQVSLWGPLATLAPPLKRLGLDVQDAADVDFRYRQNLHSITRTDIWAAAGLNEFLRASYVVVDPECLPLGTYETLAFLGDIALLRGDHPIDHYFSDVVRTQYFTLGSGPRVPAPWKLLNLIDAEAPVPEGEVLAKSGFAYGGRIYSKIVTKQHPMITKVTTWGVAAQEALFLSVLAGTCSPRLLGFQQGRNWTALQMEFIDGIPLDTFITTATIAQVAALRESLVYLLECLDRGGVRHNDLWASNLLVTPALEIIPLDFGSANFLNSTPDEITRHHKAKDFLQKFGVDPEIFPPMVSPFLVAPLSKERYYPNSETDAFLVGTLLRHLGTKALQPLATALMHKPQLSFPDIRERIFARDEL